MLIDYVNPIAIKSINEAPCQENDIDSLREFVQEESLQALRIKVGKAVVKWIKAIAENSQKASNTYSEDRSLLQKGIWYAYDLLVACKKVNEMGIYNFIKKDNKQLIGHLPADYFDRIPGNSGIKLKFRTWEFIAKSTVIPSAALQAAFNGLSIIDCGMACQMARYLALRDIIGELKFNRLFGKEVGQRINIGSNEDKLQPMRYFVCYFAKSDDFGPETPGNRSVVVGDLVGFRGVPHIQ